MDTTSPTPSRATLPGTARKHGVMSAPTKLCAVQLDFHPRRQSPAPTTPQKLCTVALTWNGYGLALSVAAADWPGTTQSQLVKPRQAAWLSRVLGKVKGYFGGLNVRSYPTIEHLDNFGTNGELLVDSMVWATKDALEKHPFFHQLINGGAPRIADQVIALIDVVREQDALLFRVQPRQDGEQVFASFESFGPSADDRSHPNRQRNEDSAKQPAHISDTNIHGAPPLRDMVAAAGINATATALTEHSPTWRGQWARIWMQPSVFSAQRYLVGMAMLDADGLRDFRLITGTEKFACVYGEDGRAVVDQIIAQTRQALAIARDRRAPPDAVGLPPGVTLDPVGMAADRTPEHALAAAWAEAEIPMEYQAKESHKTKGTMDTTSPTPQVFTHTPRPPKTLSVGSLHQRVFDDDFCLAEVHRFSVMNTASVELSAGLGTSAFANVRQDMTPTELRALAAVLIDAAADIEANPAGGVL